VSGVRLKNWRPLLSVCAGVLLLLPLVLLLARLLQPEVGTSVPPGVRISPMLDNEQRMKLMMYGRPCSSSAECDPPLGCLYQFRYGQAHCTDSQCTTDAQCPEGQVCRGLATDGNGPHVRICIPVGVRQEGEGCFIVPRDQKSACAPGLLCGGLNGWCSRPCRLSATAECPAGSFCVDTRPEPVCLPTCEKRGCPAGEQCIRFDEGSSMCAQVYGADCQRSPCPDGGECSLRAAPSHPGKVWMECVERCGEGRSPCSAGKVCDAWHCLSVCDPKDPAACGVGYRCGQGRPDAPIACRPDYTEEMSP
jgi:Cys-rich repeat protein